MCPESQRRPHPLILRKRELGLGPCLDVPAFACLQGTVERASRLPCRYSYGHASKNVGKDADVATGVPSGSGRSTDAAPACRSDTLAQGPPLTPRLFPRTPARRSVRPPP